MRWNIVAIAALGLALSLSGVAGAAGHGAQVPLQGDNFVTAKDPLHHTVTIGSQVFRVTPSTVLEDLAGSRVSFAGIVTRVEGTPSGSTFMYHYEAVATNDGPVLRMLRMIRVPQ